MYLTAGEIDEALSPGVLDTIRSAPRFRATVERTAAALLSLEESQDEATRWMLKDLGRTSLYFAALIIEATLGKVSVYDLMTGAAANKTCSRGRVLAFITHLKATGRLEIARGEGHWTKRALILAPAFYDYGRARFWRYMECAAALLPEAAGALRHRDDPRALNSAFVASGRITVLRRDLFCDVDRPVRLFLEHNSGERMLYDWLGRQQPGRERLLEEAPLARTELARRHGVSRAHLNAMLEMAQGLVTLPSNDRVVFSKVLSDDLERHFAFLFQLYRACAMAILTACGTAEAPGERRA